MKLKEMLGISKNGNAANEFSPADQNIQNKPIIPKSLFVDPIKPKNNINKNEENNQKPLSIVLEKRWSAIGYDDGYGTSNVERKNARISAIKSEISLAISKMIEDIKNRRDQVSSQVIALNNDASLMVSINQLKHKEERLTDEINNLIEGRKLLNENKGTFSKPIFDYEDGFSDGVNDKIKRDLLGDVFKTY